ncbi:hypothetical protein [Sphingomonas echinoides]|uniref:hypothetical protein n=1 Tax=Sphingomonas echinoides TaxID=59803 RepID=UPI0024132DD7|nr:hypothetical protein [Sphingomonas echinoides]
MHLAHIVDARVVLALSNSFDIIDIMPVSRTYRPPPCVIRLGGIVPETYGPSRIADHRYFADGLACLRLLNWTIEQRLKWNGKTLRNAFNRLFTQSPTDAIKPAMRVFAGTWSNAPGEEATFINDEWHRHPREMMALAVAGELDRQGLIDPRL